MSIARADGNAHLIAVALHVIGMVIETETIEEGAGIEIIEAGEMTPVRRLEDAETILLTRDPKLDEITVEIDPLIERLRLS